MAKKETETPVVALSLPPLNLQTMGVTLVGTSPLMINRMSAKAIKVLGDKHRAGSVASKGKKREPRDFQAEYEGAFHVSTDGWYGVHASAIRNACIDVCRVVGFQMTKAKMSIFVEADGFDKIDGTPLIRIIGDEPEYTEMAVRNETGVLDLRARPIWRNWRLDVRVRFDADQFSFDDAYNLLFRAGQQVGIGEGRPFSKKSNGMGFGMFAVTSTEAKAVA